MPISKLVRRVEAKACSAGHGGTRAITFFSDKGKSNTSFGPVKGLLLFVCTHKTKLCAFIKQRKQTRCAFCHLVLNRRLHKSEPKLSEYMPHRHDKALNYHLTK